MGPTRTSRTKLYVILAMIFAMTFPTVAAWSYFLGLAGDGRQVNAWQQRAYVGGKIIQFGFPLAFLVFLGWQARAGSRRLRLERQVAEKAPTSGLAPTGQNWDVSLESERNEERWRPLTRAPGAGLRPGLIFGLAVATVMLGVYFGLLRGTSLLARTPDSLRHKLQEVDMATPARYLLLAVFVVAAHSLLEEYYWRWFVFGGLRRLMPLVPAMILSSLAFMGHHVIVLYVYLPGKFFSLALPFSLAIAAGGAVWAYLYDRSGSLYAPWLSHLLVDAAIFAIGWDLLWPT